MVANNWKPNTTSFKKQGIVINLITGSPEEGWVLNWLNPAALNLFAWILLVLLSSQACSKMITLLWISPQCLTSSRRERFLPDSLQEVKELAYKFLAVSPCTLRKKFSLFKNFSFVFEAIKFTESFQNSTDLFFLWTT